MCEEPEGQECVPPIVVSAAGEKSPIERGSEEGSSDLM